jgi:epoxide hydrolase-like predicted phosphatase
MAIHVVVFDIGGVLEITPPMDFDKRWEPRLGLQAGALSAGMTDVWSAGAIGAISEAEVHQELRDRLRLSPDQADAIMDDMWRQYLGTANTELIEYARQLHPTYRTGVLSNSMVGAREREQAAYGFEDLVDDLVYSHEVGMSKPDPRIYALTCERHQVEPAEMVFIDDAPLCVEAAQNFGINAVLFEDNKQAIAEVEAFLATHG